jgi:hypothetical protein
MEHPTQQLEQSTNFLSDKNGETVNAASCGTDCQPEIILASRSRALHNFAIVTYGQLRWICRSTFRT